jgi:hypothetical protein
MLTMTGRRECCVYRVQKFSALVWFQRLLIIVTILQLQLCRSQAAAISLPSPNKKTQTRLLQFQSAGWQPFETSSLPSSRHPLNAGAALLLSSSAIMMAVLGTHPLVACALPTTTTTTTTMAAIEKVQQQAWKLGNGEVELSDPLAIAGLKLRHPRLLGSGGGGAVFSMENAKGDKNAPSLVAVKVSWRRSAASVEKECQILRLLQDSSVSGVVTCLGQAPYPTDPTRAMIALQPVFTQDVVNSISEIEGLDKQSHAVQSVVQTMVEMLAARTVTTDVQPLISQRTGDVLFIDLTEAKVLASADISLVDLSLASSFVSEMLSLVPESLQGIAAKALWQELEAVGDRLPVQFCEILCSQNGEFLLPETLEYLNAAMLRQSAL